MAQTAEALDKTILAAEQNRLDEWLNKTRQLLTLLGETSPVSPGTNRGLYRAGEADFGGGRARMHRILEGAGVRVTLTPDGEPAEPRKFYATDYGRANAFAINSFTTSDDQPTHEFLDGRIIRVVVVPFEDGTHYSLLQRSATIQGQATEYRGDLFPWQIRQARSGNHPGLGISLSQFEAATFSVEPAPVLGSGLGWVPLD